MCACDGEGVRSIAEVCDSVQNVRLVRQPHVVPSRFQLRTEGGWDNIAGMVQVLGE